MNTILSILNLWSEPHRIWSLKKNKTLANIALLYLVMRNLFVQIMRGLKAALTCPCWRRRGPSCSNPRAPALPTSRDWPAWPPPGQHHGDLGISDCYGSGLCQGYYRGQGHPGGHLWECNKQLMRTSTWVKYLPALARMATPAMAVTWAAVKTTGAAPAAAMVRPKVASDLGTRVTIIRSEASPRASSGRIWDIYSIVNNWTPLYLEHFERLCRTVELVPKLLLREPTSSTIYIWAPIHGHPIKRKWQAFQDNICVDYEYSCKRFNKTLDPADEDINCSCFMAPVSSGWWPTWHCHCPFTQIFGDFHLSNKKNYTSWNI